MKRLAAVLALVALAVPASASAHATLLRTSPVNGAVLAKAPQAVVVEFDDSVRRAGGNAVVENGTRASGLGGHVVARGRTLTLPLRSGLPDGDYSVRWSVVSEDGHREQGVLAFAVGAGRATPHPVLGAAATLTWNDILLRSLYYLGLLAGAGAAIFWVAARRVLGGGLQRPLGHLLFFSLLLVFVGGSGIVHTAPPGTRFALVMKVALTVSLAGGAAAALAPTIPRLLPAAAGAALALLAAPTLAGHSLDRDQPRVLAPLVDLAHSTSAATWLGGLLALVFVVPRATADADRRTAAARRFSATALAAVAVLGVTGLGRALTELDRVSQVWSTSYGRALLVKTALFVPLLGVGWLNRAVLIRAFARLRRSALVEVGVIAAIVVAVAVLTELRPGTEPVAAATALAAPRPPVLPPRDAVVDARELGSLAVAVARTPGHAQVTLLGPDNTGVDGRRVAIDGQRAAPCGSGCYRAPAGSGPLDVTVDGKTMRFTIGERAPDRTDALAGLTRMARTSRTIVWDETLRSSPENGSTTRFTVVAPDRLSYRTRGGPSAIVIGNRRWDRTSDADPWIASQQTPLRVTQPYWTRPTNAHAAGPSAITFLDRRIPAWFRIELGPERPRALRMTAAAHFMVVRYVAFDGPATVSPPSR